MSATFNKRINKEIQLYQKDNFSFPNLILQPDESDLTTWYFLIHDLKDTDYEFTSTDGSPKTGIYLGKVLLPPKYPFKAPDFIFLTPSGRFEINKKICTSFTGFHNELYSPSWNIASMCAGLISFMTDRETIESKGIGGISSTKEEKQQIAKDSIELIKNNAIFNKYFGNYSETLFH
jgi:ubiquitin-protein ligase